MKLSLLWSDPFLERGNSSDRFDRENKIIDFLREIKNVEAPRDERIEAVRHCLHGTSSDMVRNQAALALVDLMAREAALDIIRALRAKDISKSSGTLLFALNEIEAEIPLDILAKTVVDGSYEAQNEAMFALEQNRVAPADQELEEGVIADITRLLTSNDGATAEIADNLLAYIEQGKLVNSAH